MKHISIRITTLWLVGAMTLNQGLSLAKEPSVFTPVMTRQDTGYYNNELKPLGKLATCDQAVSEDDGVMDDFRRNLYTILAENLSQFPSLENASFSAFLTLSRDGLLVSINPVSGLSEPDRLQTFKNLVGLKESYGQFPSQFGKQQGRFYISSDGLRFLRQYPAEADRIRIISELANDSLRSWIKKINSLAKSNWHPGYYPLSSRTEVIVYIDASGTVLKRSVVTSSCNPNADNQVLQAIDSVGKFPSQPVKPPMGYSKVLLRFDYQKLN